MNRAVGIAGGILTGLALLYPLSSGPMMRFYVHAYIYGNAGIVIPGPEPFVTFRTIYDPLFWCAEHSSTVEGAMDAYWRLWLWKAPRNVPQSN